MIAVVDYGIGNLRSAQKSLQLAGADARLTNDPVLIADADGVALPGVGHFGTCMQRLRAAGLEETVQQAATSGKPFIGICVGMQMLFESSAEAPGVPGLAVLPGTVEQLSDELPRPQIQWNKLRYTSANGASAGASGVSASAGASGVSASAGASGVSASAGASDAGCPLLTGLPDGVWMYFVHSYAVETNPELVVAVCDYPDAVAALVQRGRLWAAQFHPEKSGPAGIRFIANFVDQVNQTSSGGNSPAPANPAQAAK